MASKNSSKTSSKSSAKKAVTTKTSKKIAIKRPTRAATTIKQSKKSRQPKRLPSLLSNRQIFIFVLALVLFMIGSTYAYAMYAANQPANVLKMALAKTLRAESADVAFSMFDSSTINSQKATWQLAGPVTAKGTFELNGNYTKVGKSLGINLKSVDGKEVYLRVNGLTALPSLLGTDAALYGITEQQNPIIGLDGDWLIIPANIKDTVLQDQPADGTTSYSLPLSDRQKLADLYERHEFLRVSKTYADDTIDGNSSRHYLVTVDSDAFKAYLQAAQRDVKQLKLADKRITSLATSASQLQSLDVWISATDKRFNKISLNSGTGSAKRTVELTATNYDRDVDVAKPIGAEPLLEALTSLRKE